MGSSMPGWDYDDDYKRELDRPSSWEEVLPTALLTSPHPQALPNPRQIQPAVMPCYPAKANENFTKCRDRGSAPRFPSHYIHSSHDAHGGHRMTNGSSNLANYQQGTSRGARAYNFDRSNYGLQDIGRNVGTFSRESVKESLGRMRLEEFPRSMAGASTTDTVSSRADGAVYSGAYENIPVEVKGEGVPTALTSFQEMNCNDIVQQNIKRCGYTQPTPIQKHAIPICMSGRDLMASAQTGSGKTAAFCLPIIAGILRHCGALMTRTCAPCALILSPTRELTCQIHAEAKKFSHQTSLRVTVVYGGAPIAVQINELHQGADILVATPGRLKDLIERRKVSLSQVKYLVLDEADRMLDMGFEPQIRCIVEEADMPSVGQRQTMLFSATFPEEIKELASKYLSNSIFVSVGRVGSSTDLILQKVEHVDEFNKRNRLLELVKMQQMDNSNSGKQLMVVFAQTKREVDSLDNWLCRMGYRATSIHGDRTQYERERALKSFRAGNKPILIATDVAARGLDVQDVSQVLNYDLPQEIDSYVHRIGRTGRAGKMGTAISFFCEKDASLAKPLVKLLRESKQDVPEWLLEYAAMERSNVHSHGRRGLHARRW